MFLFHPKYSPWILALHFGCISLSWLLIFFSESTTCTRTSYKIKCFLKEIYFSEFTRKTTYSVKTPHFSVKLYSQLWPNSDLVTIITCQDNKNVYNWLPASATVPPHTNISEYWRQLFLIYLKISLSSPHLKFLQDSPLYLDLNPNKLRVFAKVLPLWSYSRLSSLLALS